MTHGTSASPLQDAGSPSDPVDMTGIGEDDNSERLIYQDALRGIHHQLTLLLRMKLEHLALLFLLACLVCVPCTTFTVLWPFSVSWYDCNILL